MIVMPLKYKEKRAYVRNCVCDDCDCNVNISSGYIFKYISQANSFGFSTCHTSSHIYSQDCLGVINE